MPGPNPLGGMPPDLPPDLPPEYVEAYRRGYQRAFEQGAGEEEAEQTARLESLDAAFKPVSPDDPQARTVHPEDEERRRILAPLMLVVLALLLVVSAYGVGRLFASTVGDADSPASEPDGVVLGGDESPDPNGTQKAYDGRVHAAAIGGASASCQSPSGVDAAGRRIGYEPRNVYDGKKSTAWRCGGSGIGQRITLALPDAIEIGQVAMVPGYAKTDPLNGANRYAQNNRITRARWSFSDGTSVVQKLNGSARNRSLQKMRIPRTEADQVVIEILRTTRGPRNTVAISEIKVGQVSN